MLPAAPERTRALVGDVLTTTLSAVGEEFSERLRTEEEITAYADAVADMVCAYLREVGTKKES